MKRPIWLRIVLFATVVAAAWASYCLQLNQLNSASLSRHTNNFDATTVDYCVTTTPAESKKVTFGNRTYSAKVAASSPFSSTGLLIGAIGNARAGECYRALVRLSPGFSGSRIFFVAKLLGKNIRLSQAGNTGVPWLRQRFLSSLRGISADCIGLVAGLSIGDTSRLSPALLADFKVLSLTHLTAVSGTNCAIVLGVVWFVIGRLKFGRVTVSRWPKFCVAGLALVGYVELVGFQASVLRAGTMAMAVLLGKTLGRNLKALNALVFTCGLLVVIDPWLIFDYSFLLSVLACVGILVVAPAMAKLLRLRAPRLPHWLTLGVAVSLSAQLLCFPVLLMLQGGFSTYSILANLIAEPLVTPITLLGLAAVFASAIVPPIASMLSFIASLFALPITWIASTVSRWPAATGFWPSGPQGVASALLMAALVVALAVARNRALRLFSAAGLVLIIVAMATLGTKSAIQAIAWAKPGWVMVSCNVGQGDATVIRSKNQVALIDVGRDPIMIDSCLKQLHISHINLLELTHFDLDHVAGLAGALQGRSIDQAMLTPFVDTRPGANDARAALEQKGVPIQLAETGLTGRLGEFQWQVLSPHRGAFEAVDSNDGSITMLWRSTNLDIITLADLGQKGQMRLFAESNTWFDAQLANVPLIMKVSHHGSADQFADLIKALHPVLALISVGKGNSYGHPTPRTLNLLASIGSNIERTDQHGSISVAPQPGGFGLGFQGEQGKTG